MRLRGILPVLVVLLGVASAQPNLPKQHRSLDHLAEFQGFACAKGHAWFYADGHLASCTLARAAAYGEVHADPGAWITLRADGRPWLLVLPGEREVLGMRCRGGGGAEGPTTTFYHSGKLEVCWLAGDQTVQGVPCRGGGFISDLLTGGSPARLSEDGRLKSCVLSKDYGSLHRGDKYVVGR